MDENQDNSIPKDTLNPKIGVYVCRCGGNISDYIDTEALAATAAQIPGVSVSTVNSFMCSDPGQNLVEQDVKAGKVDRVVVASCSPFLHEITFQAAVKRGGLNPYLYTHVNIREQGSWAHGHQGKDATKLAMLNIAAGIGKVRHVEPLEKIRLPSHRRVLVLGGGVAGMKAAIDVAKRGLPALIVEPADKLGGRTASIPKTYPRGESGADHVAALQKEIDSCDDIVAMTGSKVTGIKGFIGNFDITVTTGDKSENHAVGTIIVATGFDPYQPANGEYGFGHEQVATLPEFMDELGKAKDAAAFTWKGKPVRSIAMIHCVGSRQCEGVQKPQPDGEINDYCSRICCTSLLRTAVEVCERFPETKVYDFHQDIRTYGRGQEDYYIRASELGVTFFRWDGEEHPSVWSPLGDFFGTAAGANAYRSLPAGLTEGGWWYANWYMPFAKQAEITIANDGDTPRKIVLEIEHAPLKGDPARYARFHAKWHRDAFLPEEPERRAIDWTLLKTTGRGRFVGVNLHVWNPRGAWWGEGDEKFFVDGEKFPSTIGTGSEDYFGYAWCNPTCFANAFHNQTISMNNKGHISVNRWHIADAIPFQRSFEAAIEKYFPNSRPTLYAATVYWYEAPGGDDPYRPWPVAERAGYWDESMLQVWRAKGAVEGEKLKVLKPVAGQPQIQDMSGWLGRWSGDAQLWWTRAKPGDQLNLALPVKQAGRYVVKAQFTKAVDYGVMQILLNGRPLGKPLDFFNPNVIPSGELTLGTAALKAGENRLAIRVVGANPKAVKAYMCGLDYLKLEPAP